MVEGDLGIICVCLPLIGPIFGNFFRGSSDMGDGGDWEKHRKLGSLDEANPGGSAGSTRTISRPLAGPSLATTNVELHEMRAGGG